jgi:succinate dehydrogenase / fumarate reductase iron-sulfur subunit
MTMKKIHLIITRQKDENSPSYREEFLVPYRENMNVISALMEIQKRPVNVKGEVTSPIQWESSCLEEVCGACTMLINGKPRQACSSLIDQLKQPIRLGPLKTFPVIRDLIVNRERLFDALKKVKAWIPIDGTYDLGAGPRIPEKTRQWAYELSKCMTCGCCLEACPNVNSRSHFIGAAPLSQVRLLNAHPTGEMNKEERMEAILGKGGIAECGNSQNCVQVCPKGIPLTTSIAHMNRKATVYAFKKFFGDF